MCSFWQNLHQLLDCNPSEMVENHVAPNALVTLKTTNLSPVKPSNASDQVALLPTAEPIDNNNSVYQNYDAMCRHSTYNNRETLICDAPLNKSIGHDAREPKEDYYNFTVKRFVRFYPCVEFRILLIYI